METDLIENYDGNMQDAKSLDKEVIVSNIQEDNKPQPILIPPKDETARIFGVSEEKLTTEFNYFKAQKLLNRLNYMVIDGKISDSKLKNLIKTAIEVGLESVTVFPSKLKQAIKYSGGKIKIRVACLYPFCAEVFKDKLKAVTSLSRQKPDAIEMPFELSNLYDKRNKVLVKEWKKLKKKAGKANLIMTVEVDLLSVFEISTIVKIAKEAGINKIKTSTCLLIDQATDYNEGGITNCFEGLLYETASKVLDSTYALSMFKWGADTVSTPDAISVAKNIKKVLGCDDASKTYA